MAYKIDGMAIARRNGHTMDLVGTAHIRPGNYSVDKYLCHCGKAEVQIASTSVIGVWLNDGAERPCTKQTATCLN